MSVKKRYQYYTKEQLDELLQMLLSVYTVKVYSIRIDPRWVSVDLSEDIDIQYSVDNVLDEIRRKEVKPYDYEGSFTPDVLFAMLGEMKKENLIPGYLVMNPASFLKKLPHWECAAIITTTETRFMGMAVVEDSRLDEDTFIVAGCSGNEPRIYTIDTSYKGIKNE